MPKTSKQTKNLRIKIKSELCFFRAAMSCQGKVLVAERLQEWLCENRARGCSHVRQSLSGHLQSGPTTGQSSTISKADSIFKTGQKTPCTICKRVRKIRDKSADTKTRGGRAGGYSQAPEQRFPCILWRSTGWMCPDGGCSLWGTHKGAWRTKAGAVCSWRTASHRMDSSWSSSGRTAARGKDLYWKLIKDCIYGSGTMLEQRNIVWDRRSGTDGALQSDHSLPFPIVMVSRVGGDRRARKGMKLSLGRRGTVWG